MKKQILAIALCILINLFWTLDAFSATIYLNDSFTDLSQIHTGRTTAEVDTANGWVTLALKNLANSLVLYEDNYDITVINGRNVETYQFDGSQMALANSLSVTAGLTDPVSISSNMSGQYLVLDKADKTAQYYQFDGTSMTANPFLSVTGLTKPLAVGTQKDTYDFTVLDDHTAKWYSFDGSGLTLNNFLSLDLGEAVNPVSLSTKADGFDYGVVDKLNATVTFYSFDGSAIALNPLLSITSPGELVSPKSVAVNSSENSYAVVANDAVKMYSFDGSQMVYNSILSAAGLNKPLAVALKPNSYDYAVIDLDNTGNAQVRYFAFTGSGMEEIDGLKVTGLGAVPYDNDQVLMGKAVDTASEVKGLKLNAMINLPLNTSILWEVTVDGTTWLPITPGGDAVRFAAAGTHPNYRAVLHTTDTTVAPKILDVQLFDASLTIVGRADKTEYKAGEAMIFYADTEGAADRVEAAMWWTGGNDFTMDITTSLVPDSPISSDINTWSTRHNYPTDYDRVVIIPKDMPDGDYAVIMKAYNGTNEVEDTVDITVDGSQFNRIVSEITDQRYMPND